MKNPVGIFDSGYGGLTILKEITKILPNYDYLYLGDNARTPYGTRSFDAVYQFTLECVNRLFSKGCQLVIIACNTASAKALRAIQQNDLPNIAPEKRVLGIIRPVTEAVGGYTKSNEIGILGTNGTVTSKSYPIEIQKFFPHISVYQEACPMWVPLVENYEAGSNGTDYFIEKHIKNLFSTSDRIDTLILACTHYPLLLDKIKQFIPEGVTILSQGEIVANSLADYLKRHPEIETNCSKGGDVEFLTTDSPELFDQSASMFFGQEVSSSHLEI